MVSGALARANAALSAGDWGGARVAFEAGLADHTSPEALEGLSHALWWEGDEDQALSYGQQAYLSYRRRGNRVRALRCALWVANEYLNAYGEKAAANGWMARAQRLSGDDPGGNAMGWLALARARRSEHPDTAEQHASEAVAIAGTSSDSELEAHALAQVGLARVSRGDVEGGLSLLDEAMALATSLEDLMVAGDVACTLMQAAELIGDLSPFMNWAPVIERYLFRLGHSALISSCGTCCGQVFAGNGDLENAAAELTRTIARLEKRGQMSRCSHPSAALASLRIREGRLKDAEAILDPYLHLPESVAPSAELLIVQNQPVIAMRLLQRRLARIGRDHLGAVPLLSLLARAEAASHEYGSAAATARDLGALADRSGLDRVRGLALLAAARAEKDRAHSQPVYEHAIETLEMAGVPLEAATSRIELARLLVETDPGSAIIEARSAASSFERLGASYLADQANAFLRALGVRGRTGPKLGTRLTERESEVLQLIAEGLTNAEIADRLFISPKTAANHVGNVLMKLGVRSRTEAAAVALTTS